MSEDSQKVPSQVFRWFEKMKNNYEQSVQGVLQRFEQYSHKQELRIDQANQSHIDNLKQVHQQNIDQQNSQISQLSLDINYYKEQIAKQQQTIEQLNGRYDTVMSCLLSEKKKDINIKDVFSDEDFVEEPSKFIKNIEDIEDKPQFHSTKSDDSPQETTKEVIEAETALKTDDNELFDQAILKRQSGDIEQAFQLFEQAAKLGHAKSMGAMGRSFFLGEGTEENHTTGLAWLIHAANQALPPAIDRVKHFQENDPELYQQALMLAEQLYSS
jgi:TPR repeat protein